MRVGGVAADVCIMCFCTVLWFFISYLAVEVVVVPSPLSAMLVLPFCVPVVASTLVVLEIRRSSTSLVILSSTGIWESAELVVEINDLEVEVPKVVSPSAAELTSGVSLTLVSGVEDVA